MGFEPTTLRDLVGCSNHWGTRDSMASKGEMWVFDWNRITRSHSQICHGACCKYFFYLRADYSDASSGFGLWAKILRGQ